DLATAERSLGRLMELATGLSDQQATYRAHLRLGQVSIERGNLTSAREHTEKAIDIASRRSKLDPKDNEWQLALSEAQMKLGGVLFIQGNLPAALQSFNTALTIRERI